MSKGTVNKVVLIGRLGQDPEVRYIPAGDAIANFRIATNDGYKDKDGKYIDQVEWHTIKCWRKLAEMVASFVKKGQLVCIDGKLKTEKWQDKDGSDRYTTYILANDIQLLGSKPGETDGEAQ